MKTNRVVNLLVAGILLTLVSAALKYVNVTKKNEYMALTDRAYQIIRRSTELEFQLADVERYERTFLVRRDSGDLKAFHEGIKNIHHVYDTLVTLVSDHPSESTLIHSHIKSHIDRFTQLTGKLIETRLQTGATFQMRNDSTRSEINSLTAELQGLINEEDNLLRTQAKALKKITTLNDIIHYSSFVIICVISGLALKVLLEKEKHNQELLASLREVNKSLEKTVEDRTAELERKSVLTEKLNRDLKDNFDALQLFYDTLHDSNKRAEDTLREMRDLYDNAPIGFHSLDAAGVIVRMNQTELNWLGYSGDEIIGKKHFYELIAPEEIADYKEHFATFVRQGYIHNIRHTLLTKSGERLKIILNATAIHDEDGHYVMSRGVSYRE